MATNPAVAFLSATLFERCIDPCLRSASEEEFVACLDEKWETFVDTLDALEKVIVLQERRTPRMAEKSVTEVVNGLRHNVAALAGEHGATTFDFATATYLAALRVLATLDIDAELNEDDRKKDCELAARYSAFATLHVFSLLALTAVAAGASATAVAIDVTFELLREGALEAYSAVREAVELRLAPSEPRALDEHDADDMVDPVAWAEADLVS